MDVVYDSSKFTSRCFDDQANGCAGLELFRTLLLEGAETQFVGRVIYWDAAGSWWLELVQAVPLLVLEKLVQEAKLAVFPNGEG